MSHRGHGTFRRPRRQWLAALLTALVACALTQENSRPVQTRQANAEQPQGDFSDAGGIPPQELPSLCKRLQSQFEQALASGGACSTDADCSCHDVLGLSGALGVTDHKTAARLNELVMTFDQNKCPSACVQTAVPPTCVAHCVDGRCR